MYCTYQDRKELEDDLYQEDEGDSEGSEANSELEFHLYSQLHYSSNAGVLEEQEDRGGEKAEGQNSQQLEVPEKTVDVDGEQEQTGQSRPSSPDLSELLQHLKNKKGEKSDKQKKGRSDPKGQRSSSSFFEEVIVIDSSPDVISISDDDTTDDDKGVCALKGRGLNQRQTSTPAQQGTQKRSLRVPVTVNSSSSESDSEESESKSESSDSSDSDGLENWMILGRGKQDGDQSISLNLEGGSDSNTDVEEEVGSWLVSAKDKEARIYNKDKGARITVSNRYYTNKNVQCRNCNKNGHLSKNCPEPKKLPPCFLCGNPGHLVSGCPNKHCNNCGVPGHLYNSCSERAYWRKQCERCSMTGHFSEACPEIWRQYHNTTKEGPPGKQQRKEHRSRHHPSCYNCSRKGHYGHACKLQRMFNGTYPSTPFINHYDTAKDIKCRQDWIMSKAKELKKNGFLPACSQTPLTPGPPKKKQKISHHKSNPRPYHTPHQSPNKPTPKSSHIFFNDNDDFGSAAPKTNNNNKHKQQKGASNVKPWKPKRPVPTAKDSHPPTKLILDEADDFPRGGGKGEDIVKKRNRLKKTKQVPLAQPEGHRKSRPDRLCWTVTGEMQGSASKQEKGKRKKRNRARKSADKKGAAQMYPTDENLFIIKQKKKRNRYYESV
ncbi:zinc finger CCHC domain-containing protein 7 [Sander lucioperca]|uniref:zinc finger CCHC domain-containing protein 7 n=1 Tax=Sander lucioperca TaxID=283035 RepID=UPI00125CEB02|nr:zinc finger CCHC domain-containing protein 7 [Sander lucioperca]